jgi:sugar lactone lactonase YvrE
MDGQRFDAALRALGLGATRRQALAGALGAALGLTAVTAIGETSAEDAIDDEVDAEKKKRKRCKPSAKGRKKGGRKTRCRKNAQCCSLLCKGKRRRKRKHHHKKDIELSGLLANETAPDEFGFDEAGYADVPAEDQAEDDAADEAAGITRAGEVGTEKHRRKRRRRCRCRKVGATCKQDANCCTRNGAKVACVNGVCGNEDEKIPTGKACTDGDTCEASAASCTEYASGKPKGTYCLLPNGKACTANGDCVSDSCENGVCANGGPTPPACDATTCPTGCCDGDTCVAGTSGLACGTGGAACVTCSSLAPICAAGICVAGTEWVYSTQFGTQGSGDTNLDLPNQPAISPDGLTVWIADSNNNRVVVWNRSDASSTAWTYSTQFGSSGSGDENFGAPWCVAVSADTLTAWVADGDNKRVVVWTRPDATSTAWSYNAQFGSAGSGDGNFDNPAGVAIAPDTLTVWVTDGGSNNRVSIWTRPDATSTAWSYNAQFGSSGAGDENFSAPFSIALSPDTLTAWIADTFNNRVVIWTRPTVTSTAWTYNTQLGTQGSGDSNLSAPWQVAVSADTLTAWVADTFNSRIVIWTRPDTTSTAWSYSTQFGSAGAGDSNLNGPTGVAIASDSRTAWITDSQNFRMVIWTLV